MPQVAVQINGKTYRMACDEGQEAHLLDLAHRFNKTIDSLRGSFGEIGDQRLTVMAGIMVQDQLVEQQHKVRGLEAALAERRADGADGANGLDTGVLAEAITKTAQRIERITATLKDEG